MTHTHTHTHTHARTHAHTTHNTHEGYIKKRKGETLDEFYKRFERALNVSFPVMDGNYNRSVQQSASLFFLFAFKHIARSKVHVLTLRKNNKNNTQVCWFKRLCQCHEVH
jgi:hypothetical protein